MYTLSWMARGYSEEAPALVGLHAIVFVSLA
jgi:hypothetical protein